MDKEIVLAADLGGTNLRMAAVDRQGTILCRAGRETPNGENLEEIVRAIIETAVECRENCTAFKIGAMAAAVPGTLDVKSGKIITSPNLAALNNFQMAAALEAALGIQVVLENDANAAAVGENWLGASKNCADSICVTLGTGVGDGIMIDGKILRGADGKAGEIGHLCVESLGAPCRCGSQGCLEQYASASAIVRIAKELASEYPASVVKNHARLKAHEVFEAGQKDDAMALEVFRQMGFYLGVAFSSLINIFNPEIIVIGGGASAGWELFASSMQKIICQRSYGGHAVQTKIRHGELGDDAGILGAARLAFNLSA